MGKFHLRQLDKMFETKHRQYIVLNGDAQFYSGLKGGRPTFSDSYDEARTLYNGRQFKTLQSISYEKLYKEYIES